MRYDQGRESLDQHAANFPAYDEENRTLMELSLGGGEQSKSVSLGDYVTNGGFCS
jgi:hypothetical protein